MDALFQWLSLRAKIILPYMLLALLLALGATFIGTRVVFDSIEERFINQLIEAGKLSSEWAAREEARLLGTLRYVVYADGVADALQAQDAERLRELVYPIAVNFQEEAIEILNAQGVTVLSLRHRAGGKLEEYEFSRGADYFQSRDAASKILRRQTDAFGDKYAELASPQRETYLYVFGPIFNHDGKIIGAAAVGKSAPTLVRQIREATLAQVTLYDPSGAVIATTWLEQQPLAPATAAQIFAPVQPTTFSHDAEVANIAYRELVGAFQVRGETKLGLLGVAFAKNFLVRVSQNTWMQLLISVAITFLLVVAIGWVISTRISRPILNLEQAANQVASGNLHIQVAALGNDEVARLTQRFNEMVASMHRSQNNLLDAYDTTLEGWVKALDLRDRETTGHSQRVAELTVELARAMNLPAHQLEHVRRGALLHDIGKMAIPDGILLKPASLTPDEWRVMRLHPTYAVQMLQDIDFLKPAIDIPAFHHEKWNGSGYPNGLQGEAIPASARIFAIIDAWDCLTSGRPYRPPVAPAQAQEYLKRDSGSHFDPQVVRAFFEMLARLAEQMR